MSPTTVRFDVMSEALETLALVRSHMQQHGTHGDYVQVIDDHNGAILDDYRVHNPARGTYAIYTAVDTGPWITAASGTGATVRAF